MEPFKVYYYRSDNYGSQSVFILDHILINDSDNLVGEGLAVETTEPMWANTSVYEIPVVGEIVNCTGHGNIKIVE